MLKSSIKRYIWGRKVDEAEGVGYGRALLVKNTREMGRTGAWKAPWRSKRKTSPASMLKTGKR